LTLYLGPEEVLLTIEIHFHPRMSTLDIRDAIRRLQRAVQSKYPRITRIYFDAIALEGDGDGER
jgi:hypothetical protein